MSDPIRTVFISGAASLLFLLSLLFYVYVFPKKKVKLFVVLLLLSLLPLLSLLRPGTYESGDFNIHIYRIMSFYDSLKEGILMPSWAAELNATYGNPLFIFNYSLPYYAISFFHFIGLSFISSMKLYLGIMFYLSGIFMFIWIKTLTKNDLAAFSAAIFYLFNPYHLIDVHFRATLGESTVFTIAPLVFYFITTYFKTRRLIHLLLISLSILLLTLAHPLLSIAILGLIIPYTFIMSIVLKTKKLLFYSLIAIFVGAAGSIYLWVPFILFAPYMYPRPGGDLIFNPFSQLFFSPWRYGFLFQGPYGELALMIGYSQIIIVLGTIFILIKKKVQFKIKIVYFIWLILFLFLLFIMHPASKFIWNQFPIFWMFIPTGRLLLPVAICTSVLAGYFALVFATTKKKNFLIYIFLFLTIGSTILNWGHRRVIPEITDVQLRTDVWKSTVTEGLTAYFLNNKWADKDNFWFTKKPEVPLEIIKGKAEVKPLERTSIRHTYVINANTRVTIKENTLYYPGWKLVSNNKDVEIFPGKRGVIHTNLSPGLQYLELTYEDVFIYKLSKIVSATIFVTLLGAIIIIFLYKYKTFLLNFFPRYPKHFSRKT